jgi:hypothetical protein
MKPLWTQTLAWLAAVLAAVLLALATPDGVGVRFFEAGPMPATAAGQ